MRIIITDQNMIWTPDNPALEPYSSIVLVVCLDGKAVTDKYECFISPYPGPRGLGMTHYGIDDERYVALDSVADELDRNLGYHDDIIFLADNAPESLYPFLALKDRDDWNSFHLCVLTPWSFEHKCRRTVHEEALRDLSSVRSLLYIEADRILSELGPKTTIPELFEKTTEMYSELLPRILYGIQEKNWRRAFFDLYTKSYLPLDEGYDMIENALKHQEIDPQKIRTYRIFCTLGIPAHIDYPTDKEYILEYVEELVPRPDGKAVCNYLRDLRLQLAAANNIPFESEECASVGPCAGTCEKCDSEARYLYEKMQTIPAEERIYPKNILGEWGGLQ